MRRSVLLPILVASTLHAGALLFQPDSVRFGFGTIATSRLLDSTRVRNTSSANALLRPKAMIAPFKHTGSILFKAPGRREYFYRIDSSYALGSRFVHRLVRDSTGRLRGLGEYYVGNPKAPEVTLAPGETIALGTFRLDDCLGLVVRAMATTAAQPTACHDELLGLVFESLDTLHLMANQWTVGLHDNPASLSADGSTVSGTRYSLDGKILRWSGEMGIHGVGTVLRSPVKP